MAAESDLIVVAADEAGTRLDAHLAARFASVSRTKIHRAIEDGDVLVNDHQAKPSYRIREGDRIEIDVPEPVPTTLEAEHIPINIVYEDEDLVVVDKPAGLVVHPGAGNPSGTLANALVYHFNQLSGSPGTLRPGIVHRIDKETSGMMVVAKNDLAHETLSEAFKNREVIKEYLALVYGSLSVHRGEIQARIGRSAHNRTRMAVLRGSGGRAAHTVFEVEHSFQEFTLLQVGIKTGRTHQIRVHMAHIGHPVVGDFTYGAGREKTIRDPRVRRAIAALNRHFLHSADLAFNHPITGAPLRFSSPLPPELAEFLGQLT